MYAYKNYVAYKKEYLDSLGTKKMHMEQSFFVVLLPQHTRAVVMGNVIYFTTFRFAK